MNINLLTSIISAVPVLLAVAITSIYQLKSQRNNQDFQYNLELMKIAEEKQKKQISLALSRLEKAHRLVSLISREFSITNLVIWRKNIQESEYDQHYMSICNEVDELRVIADLYETSLTKDVESIYGEMNIFWGNFQNVLYLDEKGEKVDHTTPCSQKAHEAAIKIGQYSQGLKGKISQLSEKYRTSG